MKKGKFYKMYYKGEEFTCQYMGREKNFECLVCGKGCNAHCFNVFNTKEEYNMSMYETFSFGQEHLPKLIEIQESEIK